MINSSGLAPKTRSVLNVFYSFFFCLAFFAPSFAFSQQIEEKTKTILASSEELIRSFLNKSDNYESIFRLFPGENKEKTGKWLKNAESLKRDILRNGLKGLALEVRPSSEINHVWAAFTPKGKNGQPIIYINEKLIAYSAQKDVERIVLEEIGHWIDYKLNGDQDTQGDEGQLFAATLIYGQVTNAFKEQVMQENDFLKLTIDGELYETELASILFSTSAAYNIWTTSTQSTTQLETNIVYVQSRIGVAGDRMLFVSVPEADPVFSGNNTRGWLYVVATDNTIKFSYLGEISRLYKIGSTVEGLQFFVYPDQTNEGYLADRQTLSNSILIDIRQPDFTVGQTYNTSSDPVSAALNDLLAPTPVSAGADASDAIEAGGINNGTAGSNAIGNVLTNDAGGLTSYTVLKNVNPMLMVTNSASVTLSTFTSSQTGAGGTVPAQIAGQYGNLQLNANGSFTYTVNNNNTSVQALRTASNTLTDVFTYKVAAGSDQAIGTLTTTIKGANDNPIAVNDYNIAKAPANPATVDWTTETLGSKATGNVLTNDTDVDAGETKTINPLTGSATVSFVNVTTDPTYNFITSNGWTSVKTGFYAYLYVSNQYRALRTSSGVPITIIKDATSFRLSAVPAQVYSGSGTTYNTYNGIAVNDQIGFDASNANTGPNNSKYAIVASINTSSQTTTVTLTQGSIQGVVAIGMDVSGAGVSSGTKISNIQYDANGNPTTINLDKAITSTNGTTITFTGNTGTEIQGRYGTLTLNSDGSYVYTPTSNPGANVTVEEQFPYTMQDLATAQSSATLYITLVGTASQDPNASPISITALEAGGTNNGTPGTDPTGNILGTSPVYVTSTLSVQVTAIKTAQESTGSMTPGTTGGTTYSGSKAGLYGTLYVQSTGAFKYVVNNANATVQSLKTGQSLTEVFNYRVTNTSGFDWSTITITLNGAYDAPVAVADANTAIVGKVNPTGEVLPNDTDVDANDTKVVSKIIAGAATPTTTVASSSSSTSNPTTINGSYGTLKIGSDGSYIYTINNSNATVLALSSLNTLTDIFTYEVKDGDNLVSTSTITITINAPNKAPVNTNPTTVTSAVAVSFPFSAQNLISVNDVDNNLYSVTLSVENGTFALTDGTAKSGLLSYIIKGTKQQINAVLATLVYTSDQGFSGTDVLTIESVDIEGLSHTTTVNIVVSASNLTVSNETVSERSPYVVFTVSGGAGQVITLSLADGTGSNAATSSDYGLTLQYYNGSAWVAYSTQVAIPNSGVLLVRTNIINDVPYEGAEIFKLIATNSSNTSFEGTGTIYDDGTGDYWAADATTDAPTTPPVPLDDDRVLTINNITVNEGSPYAVFEVSGAANQLASLTLTNVSSIGMTGLQYSIDGGTTWLDYTSGNVALNSSGKMLVRTSMTPEQELVSDNNETFTLKATNTGGTAATGTATIKDDGTGTIYNNDGTPNTTATKDDDRPLTVNNITVNEGSPYAVFEVSGAANQLTTLALANVTTTGITGLSYSTDDGLNWVTYTSGTVTLNASGKLLVRTSLTPEQETAIDNGETFTLTATNTGGSAAVGTATVKDDGTGTIFNNDGTPNTTATKDDDRPLTVNSVTVNERSPYAVFTVSGAANQLTKLSLADGTAVSADYGAGLEYYNAPAWVTYTANSFVSLDANGKLFVRTPIKQDATYEGAETFTLTVTNVSGTPAAGRGTIKDDGTGDYFIGDALTPASPQELLTAGIILDDDRPKVFADKNATFTGVQVDGSVATNDIVPSGSTYGTPTPATTNPSGAVITMNPDGTYTFKATLPGEYLYEVPVCAPGQTSNCPTAQLQITVIDPLSESNIPVVNPDLAVTEAETPVKINVLANDKAGNAGKILDPASVAVTTQPANGTVVVNSDGTITYTPNVGFIGNDVFTYKVCETGSTTNCQTTEVYVNVTPAGARPKVLASDDYNTMNADLDGLATVSGSVITNDGSTEANPTLTVSLIAGPSAAEGTIVLNANGTYTFKPKAGFSGSVDVVYTVCDNNTPSSCATATLHILVVMTDSDGDGVSDIQEIKDGTNPNDPCNYKEANQNLATVSANWKSLDCDGDGVPNGTDTKPFDPCVWGTGNPTPNVNNTIWQNGDCDSDGIPNKVEGIADQDGDGIPNYRDTDSDGDGLSDKDEAGADPTKPRDTDGDGLPDYLDLDSDNDGITDAKESGGNVKLDTDKDGIPDHLDLDADGDGITDVIEADGTDADQDGRADGASDAKGIPVSAKGGLNPPDTDKDGKPDFQDVDTDGDGIPDNREGQGTYIAPKGKDTDGDGLDDAYDKSNGGTYIVPVDTDKDGKPDWRDLDSDNDGIPDADERGPDGNNPLDTDKDGIPDYREVDSDNNGIPDNETLLIWKTATKPVMATDGTYTMNYTITLRNERPEPITNVQIAEDFTKTFPNPMSFQVMDVKSAGVLTKSASFDGRANVNLLAAGVTLNGKQQDSIIITVKIYPNGYNGDVNNIADGSATTKWGPVNRSSIDITRSGGRLYGAPLATVSTLPNINIFIADVLTPNNDGKNDKWIIVRPSNIKVGVSIFNRWGQLLYKNADYKNDWDGRSTNGFGGNVLPGGTYYYIVELSGGTIVGKDIRKGYMTLIKE